MRETRRCVNSRMRDQLNSLHILPVLSQYTAGVAGAPPSGRKLQLNANNETGHREIHKAYLRSVLGSNRCISVSSLLVRE